MSGSGTTAITLTGSASRAAYETALEQITFNNTGTNPTSDTRVIDVVVNDGIANSNTAHAIVEIDLHVVLGVDLFDLLLIGALQDLPGGAPVLGDHLGEVLNVLRHVVEQARIDRDLGRGWRRGRVRGAGRARIDRDAGEQAAR